MKATEFRIGNLLNYTTAEGDVLMNVIDWQDLKWLSENEKSFNFVHKPIPLTEEWFYNFGFILFNSSNEKGIFTVNKLVNPLKYSVFGKEIKYVHELQNWYFLITNEELTFTK